MHLHALFVASIVLLSRAGASDHISRDLNLMPCESSPPFCSLVMGFDTSVDHGPPRPYGDPLNISVYDEHCTPFTATYNAKDNKDGALAIIELGGLADDIEIVEYKSRGGQPVFRYNGTTFGNDPKAATACGTAGSRKDFSRIDCFFDC